MEKLIRVPLQLFAFDTQVANMFLEELLRNNPQTWPTTIYVSLHTADPGEDGSNEATGGSYVRKVGTFDAAASKATTNSADISFTSMPGCTVTHAGLWTAESGGTFLWGGALAASKVVNSGDTFKLPQGDLDVNLT